MAKIFIASAIADAVKDKNRGTGKTRPLHRIHEEKGDASHGE